MNPNNLIEHFAYIPVLDWRGPEFLAFYAVALVVAVIWSLRRGSASLKRFDSYQEPRDLTDPFEIAYLAGGANRVFQLALGRLLKLNLAEWKRRWNGNYVVATGLPVRVELHPVEIALLTRLQGKKKGVPLSDLSAMSVPHYAAIETRLARAGLRPTGQERIAASRGISAPPFAVFGIGLVKLLIGLVRDRPVGFLIFALVVTIILALAIRASFGNRQGYLTSGGRAALEKIRARRTAPGLHAESGLEEWSTGVALMGAAAMIGLAAQQEIAAALPPHPPSHSGGSGCSTSSGCSGTSGGDSGGSSGCGSSGCGSSCGGCGGGGGD